ncbi:MAG: hypothetical protein Q8P44_02060 [Dehalococcoidia bacterium]|nr:hypothetical protein [Dehalococcoidia bacterium]
MDISSLKGKFVGDVTDQEPKEPKFTRESTINMAHKHRGSVRLSKGLFYTREEWEKERVHILAEKFP